MSVRPTNTRPSSCPPFPPGSRLPAGSKLALLAASLVLALTPSAASAYVGPGAGITLLTALWAVIVAVVLMIGGLLAWPLRALLMRRKTASTKQDTQASGESDPEKSR